MAIFGFSFDHCKQHRTAAGGSFSILFFPYEFSGQEAE
jgi:hypothetical protein